MKFLMHTRQRKNKTEVHKKRQATYERKKEEKKTKVHQFLQLPEAHKFMSSEEEVDNGFLSHSYSWENEE
uniref:Uncharacterized protein n=1 Tax=Magallana gigas TaxID=29159 RepID=A0A8W8MDT1_MAGGI